MTYIKNAVAFLMPHYASDDHGNVEQLKKTIQSIWEQSDDDWHLVIVDDASPQNDALTYLRNLQAEYPEKITVIFNSLNRGPGHCRNVGIQWAHEQGIPISMYLDSDDICHKDRVMVTREIFSQNDSASVVYSTFRVIDENDSIVEEEKLSPSIREILDSHKNTPPQGKNAWIEIGTERGYTNLTSATSVRTELALEFLFPEERVSEDAHAWYRYSAGGNEFVYTDKIPTLYRIPSHTEGSASRTREGGKYSFYLKMAEVDEDGFLKAVDLALNNGKVKETQVSDILIKFYLKQCETMYLENEIKIAKLQMMSAMRISKEKTLEFSKNYQCRQLAMQKIPLATA
ncbi:MAG: glycosyltransferase [Pseudomonadota bacterium]